MAKYKNADSVTPKDDEDLNVAPVKALYIGTGGDLTVELDKKDGEITFSNVQDGEILKLEVTRVHDTDTTATDIVALY